MEQQNPYINPQFRQPPPPQKSGAAKWFIIGGVIAVVIGGLIFLAVNLGKRFGNKVGKLASAGMQIADSADARGNEAKYEELMSLLGDDSASMIYRLELDSLRARSQHIIDRFNLYRDGFRDTVALVDPMPFDQKISNRYFISTGRARGLKNEILQYRENTLATLNDTAYARSYRYMLMLDEMKSTVPVLGKMLGWENLYFNQPHQNVRLNISQLKRQVRSFEEAILSVYESEIYSDSSIVPKADTIP